MEASPALERTKILTEIITAWISMLALIIAGIFAGYQYLQNQKGDRVKETLTFVNRFNATPVLDARKKIATTWEIAMPRLKVILGKKPPIDEEYSSFILETIRDAKISQDIGLVIEFFEALEVCIRAEICDGDTAVQFLQPEALSFFRLHFDHVNATRVDLNDKRFAREFEAFVTR